ncbi:MAG: hypothetical protein GY876_11515 [Planctomycetes bacterium]|nr:hypothetical protein [Planctomycetota bacterium]
MSEANRIWIWIPNGIASASALYAAFGWSQEYLMSHRFRFAGRLRVFLISFGMFLFIGDIAMAETDASVDRMVARHVADARKQSLATCRDRGIELPPDFLAWIDGDPMLKASVYGCRKDPLPVLLALRSLEIDLGKTVVREEYTQLALAFAMAASYASSDRNAAGWNDGDTGQPDDDLPDVTPRSRLTLECPGDPRIPVDTKDPDRELDVSDHVINFLEDHPLIEVEINVKELPPLEYDDQGIAKPRGKPVKVRKRIERGLVGADVIASASLQEQFNAYMAANGHPEIVLECGDRVVHHESKAAVRDKKVRASIKAAHDLFHDAYRAKGRMPSERDASPSQSESMAWFIRNHRHDFRGTDRVWPRFPIEAPWPVLMMLTADDQPLREREEIWSKYRDEGEFRTYGEYIGGIAQQFDMQSARRVAPFPFSYGSIQMMWKDGGVCGTMGNIGARTHRICGVPASTAGQPGHCAIVVMEHDSETGRFRCRGGQYATGGDEVTTVHAGWNYDDVGGRRPMVFHQSVAWAVNHDYEAFIEAMVLRRAWDALHEATRSRQCVRWIRKAMELNPFAMPLIDGVVTAAPNAMTAIKILDEFESGFEPHADEEFELYRRTVRDLVHARILALPSPPTKRVREQLLEVLDRQGCENARLLARSWKDLGGEVFLEKCLAASVEYLGSPERTKNKRASQRFADTIRTWGRSVKPEQQRKAWAESLLETFVGHELLVIGQKTSVDPAFVVLCGFAERPVPTVAEFEARGVRDLVAAEGGC